MYTLEDDHETSSRLHQKDFATAGEQGGAHDEQTLTDNVEGTAQQPSSWRISPRALSGSMKRLATPGKTAASNPKAALAALTVACVAVFITALDQTVVVTALPQIITDLQVPITQLDHAAWIISAYLLGFIVVMPLMGRVSDLHGRRRIFLLCLFIFGTGSILCGLAPILGQLFDISFLSLLHIDTSSPGLVWLVAARLIQAIGGGAVVPVAMAIAGDFYGEERRGLALGIVGAITEAGGVLGPLYGALVVTHLGWQYIFYFNVPLVIVLMLAAWKLVPVGQHLKERIDWWGALLLGLALTCLSLGLAQQGTTLGVPANGASAQNNPFALALAAVFLVAFILVERKVRWPVVNLALFRRFAFGSASLVSLLVGAALMIAMADVPIYVDTVLQLKELDSGLALLRLTAMIPLGALLGGWLCSRITCRFTGVLGLLFTASGFFLMSRWTMQANWTQMTISMITAGFGFGLVIAPIGTTAINAVRNTQVGMSSAVITALRMLGMTLGLAALTSWALAYFKALAKQYPPLPANASATQFTDWQHGYAHHLIVSAHTVYCAVFFTSMLLCLIAIIPACFLWGRKPALSAQTATDGADLSQAAPEANVPATLPGSAENIINEEDNVSAGAALSIAATATISDLDTQPQVPHTIARWWHEPQRRKRLIMVASVLLVLLLIGGGIMANFVTISFDDSPAPGSTIANNGGDSNGTGSSGPRQVQLALDKVALTNLFTEQLNLRQGALSNLQVAPLPNDGLQLNLNLNIHAQGIQRSLPVEMDGKISLDKQQNLQLLLQHVRRDGLDAGPAVTAQMQLAMNEMLAKAVMPTLRSHLKGVKLLSVHSGTQPGCGKGVPLLVLQVLAPPIQGVAPQSTPMSLCLVGPVDFNKLLSH